MADTNGSGRHNLSVDGAVLAPGAGRMIGSGAVYHRPSGRCLAQRVRVARTWWARLRGGIVTPPSDGEAILLLHTCWVHSVGMRVAIDVLYLDSALRVVRVVRRLRPREIAPPAFEASYALEVVAGAADGVRRGDVLVWRETAGGAGE